MMGFLKLLEVGFDWWEDQKRRWTTVLAVHGDDPSLCPRIEGCCLTERLERDVRAFGPSFAFSIADFAGFVDPRERPFLSSMLDGYVGYELANMGQRLARDATHGRCASADDRACGSKIPWR